jgi:MOSC domain-containing protein YiiM
LKFFHIRILRIFGFVILTHRRAPFSDNLSADAFLNAEISGKVDLNMGKLLAIFAREKWGGEMSSLDEGNLVAGKGLTEDVSFGGRRQVTIIEREKWQAVTETLNADLPPESRRANLMIEGIDLQETKGRILKIGDCVIEISGETKPCAAMDEKLPGLKNALKPDWNGGAFGKVVKGGKISVGDTVVWEKAENENG